MGNSAEECAKALTDTGAAAVGTNFGNLDMFEIAKVVTVMRASTSVLILAQPKAGLPELKNGKTVFNLSPYDFVQGISEFLDAGAKIASGC
jgi:5-methyltetrahydrofolate--homocysteine methyltransferase